MWIIHLPHSSFPIAWRGRLLKAKTVRNRFRGKEGITNYEKIRNYTFVIPNS